jgi:hypothetical protein
VLQQQSFRNCGQMPRQQRKSGLVPLEGSVDGRAGYGKHLG